MNKELFDSMRKQMTPSPTVRAALSEKLAQPMKKRPVPWKKYAAVAACAALVIGAFSVYNLHQVHHDDLRRTLQLHSYVTVDGPTGYVTENAATNDTGAGGTEVNTGDLPGGAYVGDVPVQAGAEDYQKLMDHFNGTYPDWYGGAYIDSSGWLVVQLVSDKDPGDKSLELQVLDWTDDGHVMFGSCKYSLNQLNELMDRLNALPDEDPVCREFMASWGIDEEANRIELTLTEVNDHILSVLAELDPEDDAILVQVGQRAIADVGGAIGEGEDPAVHHVMPGGATVPDDEDLIADEPYYDGVRDGAHYVCCPRSFRNRSSPPLWRPIPSPRRTPAPSPPLTTPMLASSIPKSDEKAPAVGRGFRMSAQRLLLPRKRSRYRNRLMKSR